MLFSDTHATTHALQPTHALMSIERPQAWPSYLCSGNIERPAPASSPPSRSAFGFCASSASVSARTMCRSFACSPGWLSIVQWSCVHATIRVSPVFATSRPAADHGASLVRSAYAEKPVPVPSCPARVRP